MPRVKLTYPYPDWPIFRQTLGQRGVWEEFEFVLNPIEDVFDYWVVWEDIPARDSCRVPEGRLLFITGEATSIRTYHRRFLAQFDRVITCQRSLRHHDLRYFHQGHPWFVGKTLDELIALDDVPKSRDLSIITSSKRMTQGHRRRYEFCMKLKDHFGDRADLFGRGIRDFTDKWDTLAPYRYSIAIENFAEPDWMTEKLYDCFLAHTFPLYWGCPNVERYFDPGSYELIDINDVDTTIHRVETILNAPAHFQQRLPNLIAAKRHYLRDLSFFPMIVRQLRELGTGAAPRAQVRTLNPELSYYPLRPVMLAFDRLLHRFRGKP